MNKYLEDFYRVNKELQFKYKSNTLWGNISKLPIASELESILDWEEFRDIQLSDNEQEKLINIAYDFLMSLENDITFFASIKAVMFVLLEEYKGDFNKFVKDYENNHYKVNDLLVWRID